MTNNEVDAASHAALVRSDRVRLRRTPRKIGVAPGGSRITRRVTNACNPKVRIVASLINEPALLFDFLLTLGKVTPPIVADGLCTPPIDFAYQSRDSRLSL